MLRAASVVARAVLAVATVDRLDRPQATDRCGRGRVLLTIGGQDFGGQISPPGEAGRSTAFAVCFTT